MFWPGGAFPSLYRIHALHRHVERLPVRPTRYGLLFILILGAIILGALNYENNLGLILGFLLVGILLAGLLQARRCLAALRIGVGRQVPLFAGERGTFELRLQSDCDSPFIVHLTAAGDMGVIAEVFPDRRTAAALPVKPLRRGWLHLKRVDAVTPFPFGLLKIRRRLILDIRCLVYPRPLAGPFRVSREVGTGEGEVVTGGGADDFLGLRNYIPGDPLQRLAWKASSRGQGLFTKQFGSRSGGTVYLDWELVADPDPEVRLSRLCHLVLAASARQLTYGLRLPGRTVSPGSGEAHRHNCLRELALYTTGNDY